MSDGEKSGDTLPPAPRRLSDSSSDTPPSVLPERALPVGGAEKQSPNDNAPEPPRPSTDKRPPDRWVPPPSLPPPSLPPLGTEVPTPRTEKDGPQSRLPEPPGPIPQSTDQRLPPTAEPPKAEPLSKRPDSVPSPAMLPDKPLPAIAQTSATSLADAPGSSPPADAQRPKQVNTGTGGPPMRMVNSRRIMLDYDLAGIPKPDQTLLELWFTQDGKHWEKDNTALKTGSPYMVEVNREGTYGFTLVARQVGEKSEPPAPGTEPQVWVEVDWKKPVVHMVQARLVGEPRSRQLAIFWMATDNNMAEQPITLSWAEGPDGPWHTIATQVENTCRYNWQVPGNVPARVYLRVEAFDLVGNVGSATTQAPVIIPTGAH